ncbi:DUF2061 domain-containing protein [Azospirillum sp. TSH100]|uniref:DUF2061 domain-containing protein n=1 Tax=Azospirillum sp. TSH100 TaxID=652764 RepID=UPI000D6DE970|nr:DUF2061 domain-containing protein [Azospirillum sp. TSH100]QCG91214.1 DUF2061 domain-containing protein [Azospirillum sp. TSH100]
MKPCRIADRLKVVIVATTLCSSEAMSAADAPRDDAPITFDRNLGKTITYQTLSSLNDFAFGLVFAGGVVAGGVLAVASTVTEPIFYYIHENIWDAYQPRSEDEGVNTVAAKTATYTSANMMRIFATGWIVTGNPALATGYVAFNSMADSLTYATNDAIWMYVWPRANTDKETSDDLIKVRSVLH